MKLTKTIPTILIISLIINACVSKNAEQADAEKLAIPVRAIPLTRTTISRTIDYTATIFPYEEVNMAPSSPGRIDKIYVEVGDRVKKGDNLFLMDITQLYQLKLQLSSLEKDLWRLDTLLKSGSAKQQQYDQVKTQYDVTKTNVDFLDSNTLLKSPFDGIVTGRYYENGELYTGVPSSSGKPAVVTVIQINPVKVNVSISEQYYPLVKNGMSATITTDVYKNETFQGKVFRISPTVNPITRSFNVEIEVPNRNEMLKPGMFVRVAMELGEVEAFVVPSFVVLMQEGTNIRYVMMAENGVAKRVDVIIGKRFDDNLEILSGNLKEGDLVISEGQSKLFNGDKIEVVK
ncbi:MAG: efflux RND transporter periplasmic adaptor subunit [Bacteroidales bacterium]|nr:efflux RND transporter periplasmic adaptor subunit [Bacteroidales bacterium]